MVKNKNIFIDAYSLTEGGGKRYLYEFINNLDLLKIDKVYIAFRKIDNTFKKLKKRNTNKIHLIESKLFNYSILGKFFFKLVSIRFLYHKYQCSHLFVTDGYTFFFPHKTILLNQNILPFEKYELNKLEILLKIKMKILFYLFKYSIIKSKKIIFLSKYAKDLILKKIKYNSNDLNYSVINHGIDLDVNTSHFINTEQKNDFDILYVSSFFPYKNHILLIKAFQVLFLKYPHIKLTFVGKFNSYYRDILKSKFSKFRVLSSNNNFFIKDFVPMSEIFQIYRQSDLFVFPSSCENFPNILLEAMSCKIPVISSDYGPMPEIITKKKFLFNHLNVNELVNLIEKFIINENRIREENISFCDQTIRHYSWSRTAEQTIKFILYD